MYMRLMHDVCVYDANKYDANKYDANKYGANMYDAHIYDQGPWPWCMHVSMMFKSMMRQILSRTDGRTDERTDEPTDKAILGVWWEETASGKVQIKKVMKLSEKCATISFWYGIGI